MKPAPKTVNAANMKSLVRLLIAVNDLYGQLDNAELIGFGNNEAEQAYYLQYDAVQYSLDKRIWAQIEEDGGITEQDLAQYDLLIAKIDGTDFEEVQRDDE